ncbi:PorP/SprF family type IX secretion system membrane protein [Hufsiella ginkgonis]|uniref:Type IX secretion system membrane protein PorP/SprF n=1 Tax=Hufsiella ginkgonis TaxID=2695274 RepID=A0A7K1XZX4_9SPHI|nr:PorP/SprF family type IX secretion system membrane protein [Hufsiella ginkgonis]MXV16348.1 type IX secretion system membrane protein PorP/SprF [Hufsiella ginkgonis]
MKLNIRSAYFLVVSLFAAAPVLAQQGYNYNQYMNNLTPLNPAYAAIGESGTASALARKQWVGIEGSPSTVFFTGSLWLPSIKSSAGLIVANEEAGIEKQFEAQAFFAKSVSLAENTSLSVSVNAGLRRFNANYNELDSGDPKFRENTTETSGLTGIGLLLHGSRFYAGLSVPRISLKKGNDLQLLKPGYYAMGGYLLDAGTTLKLKPAILFSYVANLPLRTDVSVTAYLKEQLGFGVNYGSNREMAGILSYIFRNNIGIGYSYQFSAGAENLGQGTNSTQEVSLNYRFGGTKKGFSLL